MAERPRPAAHSFEIGQLVRLAVPVDRFDAGVVVQVAGYRGERQLRLRPIGGLPFVAHHEQVQHADLPAGSAERPRRRVHRKRRPQARTHAAQPAV